MASWGELLAELNQRKAQHGVGVFDTVRREHLAALAKHTGRSVILYATNWTGGSADPQLISITPEDVQGFMEVVRGLPADGLDLVIHSPGGQPEAAEALVDYMRSKFNDIRVIVPHAAMSAATMLACSSNRIVMGKHSSLGPIDPQFIMRTELGPASIPAYAILEQFKMAQEQCKDASLLPSWLPVLRQYGPALLVQCQIAMKLSEKLVADWLRAYMFDGSADARKTATRIAKKLAHHGAHLSHSRFLCRERCRKLGLVVDDLEADQYLQDEVLSVFHATTHTFNATGAVKIIENHLGRAFVKRQQQMVFLQQPLATPQPPGGPP
ncbi:MAG: hypothetical protein LDL15_04795 [Yonghaparkia sp.]|nr:hypothetical protein [Microcella sp.]